jgi:hypothetical protein
VAVHILWRLDTILLNLGFTLIVSAFYYNTEPIYHRLSARSSLPSSEHGLIPLDQFKPHKLFPLVVAGVFLAHFVISWIWAVAVRRVGLSAVTWGVCTMANRTARQFSDLYTYRAWSYPWRLSSLGLAGKSVVDVTEGSYLLMLLVVPAGEDLSDDLSLLH